MSDKSTVYDCCLPVKGGLRVRITGDKEAKRAEPGSRIGVMPVDEVSGSGLVGQNYILLFPPGDKSLIWNQNELKSIESTSFRPVILAFQRPRFLFEYHSAGGLLGHLLIGLSIPNASKWFHDWSEIDLAYTDGRVEYVLKDPAFPDVKAVIKAIPQAKAAGLILKIAISGMKTEGALVFGYGGASAFFTNYAFENPAYIFSPQQCRKDLIRLEDGRFELVRGFKKPDVKIPPFSESGWKAVIQGGSSWKGRLGFGSPKLFQSSPADLAGSAEWKSGMSVAEKRNRVAVELVDLPAGRSEGYFSVGMGGDIRDAIVSPETAWKSAIARNRSIADRVITRTPDPYLDAAMPMMAFAGEGCWGGIAVLHGSFSWREAYMGWRGKYGQNCYGWEDRVRTSIQNHIRFSLNTEGDNKGGLGHMIEQGRRIFYNMNEVFIDQIRQYFDYTNDLDLMREIFPVIKGAAEWEDRRLQPENEHLYENQLDTLISDQHWNILGQCTQASAYMYRVYGLLADLASRLGEDARPFEDKSARIREAMHRKLWMTRPGVFAEFLDTRGYRMLHKEPELPTIYHPAEFGVTDPLQTYQMLDWVDTHLRVENIPGGGRLYWTSDWHPREVQEYTHSTYDLYFPENLNLAMADYLVGRADEGYSLLRGCMNGMFNGPCIGDMGFHASTDGRSRYNEGFGDTTGIWGRAVVEGLFGIVPKTPDGYTLLSPQFPEDWPGASIETPHFSYDWKKEDGVQTIEWKSRANTSVHLRLPLRADAIKRVLVDNKAVEYSVEAGVGLTWLLVNTGKARHGIIEIRFSPAAVQKQARTIVKQGERIDISVDGGYSGEIHDPQGILAGAKLENGRIRGRVEADPGPAVLFVSAGTASCPRWTVVKLLIEPKVPLPAAKVWSAPAVSGKDPGCWTTVDLEGVYNASVPEVLQNVWDSVKAPPLPASDVSTGYYKEHLAPGYWITPDLSDAAWRKKVGADGIAWTADGIPFKTSGEGKNIAVVTRAAAYPSVVEFPVNASGRTLYLMISGITFGSHSHMVNLRVTLTYEDGSIQSRDLVSPFDICDCWLRYHCHNTPSAGFENIGGRFGPAGSVEVADLTRPVYVDNDADLIAIDMKPDAMLKSVKVEAVSEDVIFGVMGASVLKSEGKGSR